MSAIKALQSNWLFNPLTDLQCMPYGEILGTKKLTPVVSHQIVVHYILVFSERQTQKMNQFRAY